jgi:hypothetical protein
LLGARLGGEKKEKKWGRGDCRGLVLVALVHAIVGGPSAMAVHLRRRQARGEEIE